MWNDVFEIVARNGVWAVLFLIMLIYEVKDSREREKKYQGTIETLNNNLTVVNDIKEDLCDIKSNIFDIRDIVNNKNCGDKKTIRGGKYEAKR